MNIDNITPVSGKSHSQLLDIMLPIEGSYTFDYNKDLKDVHFIKLEKMAESKIDNIDKVFITGSRIFVIDNTIAKAAYIFDSIGHFIKKIETAPLLEEFGNYTLNFASVACDFATNELIFHDDMKSRFFYFDENGTFKTTHREYILFAEFANIKNTDNFVYLNVTDNNHIPTLGTKALYLGKKNTEILHTAPDAVSLKLDLRWKHLNSFSSYNSENKIFYTPVFSDTVYEIDGNPLNVYPKLVIHYPGSNINSMVRKNLTISSNQIIDSMNSHFYYDFKGMVLSTSDSVYFINSSKKVGSGYFYSQKSGKIMGGIPASSQADSLQFGSFNYPTTTFKDFFVSIIPASGILFSNGLCTAELAVAKKNLHADDNPVLVFFKAKKF